MASKSKRPPEHIRCGNPACSRQLRYDGYEASIPPGIAPERIHRQLYPNEPHRTVMCTCGHYTIHTPSQKEAMG
jgi:hypothetical protein